MKKSTSAEAALLAMTAFWGVSFVIVKDALDEADPFSFLALRFIVAGAACIAISRGALLDRALWRPGAWMGLFLFAGFLFQTWGLATTTPSRSAFLTSLFVVFVPIVELVMFRKAPARSAVAGSALAICGTYLLSGASFGGGLSKGDWLTVLCAVSYAVQIVLTGHWAKSLAPIPLTSVEIIVVAVLACIAGAVGEQRVAWSTGFVSAVVAMGLVATAAGIIVQTWAQRRTAAVRVALIIALEPVFATAWSLWRGREEFDPRGVAGGALILCGVVVAEVLKPKEP